jgi:hypothetical protein
LKFVEVRMMRVRPFGRTKEIALRRSAVIECARERVLANGVRFL